MRAENITVNGAIMCLKEKKSRNENNSKKYCQVNPYKKSETNKSMRRNESEQTENASKQNENWSEQTETCATDTASSVYLNNPELLSSTLGTCPHKQVLMD